MNAIVLRGDARALPLPDASVDLLVTSPPYFGLRSYTDTCRICLNIRRDGFDPAEVLTGYEEHVRTRHHYEGQIGSEATPAEWVAALVECTREWMRVLKPSGSMFVNLGDKYNSAASNDRSHYGESYPKRGSKWPVEVAPRGGLAGGHQPKSLLGLPWRYALACTDQLGLILRRDIIWAKPNGLPESVTDRCRSSHEYLFHLVRQPRYYAAVDEIREPHAGGTRPNFDGRHGLTPKASRAAAVLAQDVDRCGTHPLGKLPGSVWSIPSQPLTVPAHLGVDHYAAFPMELPRRCVLGWSPPGVCVACGEGRRPVVDKALAILDRGNVRSRGSKFNGSHDAHQHNRLGQDPIYGRTEATITGYACACPTPDAPTRPAIVADPFGGTGTTALAAAALGRIGLSFDLSADYCRLARWRTQDPGERAKALQVPKPPPIPGGMEALF